MGACKQQKIEIERVRNTLATDPTRMFEACHMSKGSCIMARLESSRPNLSCHSKSCIVPSGDPSRPTKGSTYPKNHVPPHNPAMGAMINGQLTWSLR